MAAAALMMAACSNDEIASVAQKGRTPLEIVPVVKTQTRAAQITTDNLTTLTVDVTGTFVTAGGENVVNPVLTLTKSGSTWSYTYNGDNAGPLYWPTAAQTAYFSAHTLAGGATVNEATTQQDAIGAYATKEFDGSTNPGTVSLTFKHAVAKMEFKARVNAATSGTVQATIDIKQVAVRNMKYTGTYAIPTATANQDMGVITPTTAVTSLLTDERTSTTFLTKDDAAATSLGSLFMVPQTVTAEDLSNNTWDDAYIAVLAQIRIKNGDADATMLFPSAGAVDNSSYAWVAVPMPADFTQMQAHKKYIFTINFSADALGKVDRNQDPVIPGGGQDIEIEGRSSSPVTVSVEHVYDFDAEGSDIDVNLPASAPTSYTLAESTVGMIVGTNGMAYDVADKNNLPTGVTAVAMVAYKDGSNGLAIQLNASPSLMDYDAASSYTGYPVVSGGVATWRLTSKDDWQNMFVGCAKSGDADKDNYMNPIAGFKEKIAATGIEFNSNGYWSPDGSNTWVVDVYLDDTNANASFYTTPGYYTHYVLGCLAF